MYSRAGQTARSGLSALTDFILSGGKPAARQIQRLLPATEMSGSRTIRDAGRRAAVQAGLTDELTAFPSAVSQRGGNLGLMGVRQSMPAAAPTPASLNPALRGFTGQANVGALSPEMQAIIRAAEQGRGTTPAAPGVRGVSSLAQNRPPAPLAEPPKPPVRYPEPTPASETARQITMLSPGEGEVGSMGSRLRYRPGTEGLEGRLGSTTYGRGMEVGSTSAYPRGATGPSAAELVQKSLEGGRPAIEQAGTPLLRTRGFDQYVAPQPAFGGSRGGQLAGTRAMEGGPGGSLVRSPGGAVVDELLIDPVRVREIFETSPELLTGKLRNAAGGVQSGNLSALLSDPTILTALSALGIGAAGAGIGSMMTGDSRDKVGQSTAQAPDSTGRALFTEDGVTPLGDNAPAIAPPTPPAPGVIDPSAAAAPVITSGGAQRESAVREALAQAAPGAAAVQRATEPMSPEKYRSIEEYYAARKAYADNANQRRELMRFMEGQSAGLGSQLSEWAEANPTLAYEYQRRQLANPAANQQSAEAITTTVPTAEMGTDNAANAMGMAEAAGLAATAPTQGAFDLMEATRPQVKPNLQRVQDFIQRQAPRSAMYAGY